MNTQRSSSPGTTDVAIAVLAGSFVAYQATAQSVTEPLHPLSSWHCAPATWLGHPCSMYGQAHPTLRDLVVVTVHNPHPDVPDGRADRAGPALPAGEVERGDRRGFRQAVAFQHRDAERLLEPAQHLDRQGRAAG